MENAKSPGVSPWVKQLNAPSETRAECQRRVVSQEHAFPPFKAITGLVHLVPPHDTLNQKLTSLGNHPSHLNQGRPGFVTLSQMDVQQFHVAHW